MAAIVNGVSVPSKYLERIHDRTIVKPTGCWQWDHEDVTEPQIGVTVGYYKCRVLSIKRVLFANQFGRLTRSSRLRRLCDNPRCLNPEHYEAVNAPRESNIHICWVDGVPIAKKNIERIKLRLRENGKCLEWDNDEKNPRISVACGTHPKRMMYVKHILFAIERVKITTRHKRLERSCGNPRCLNPEHHRLIECLRGKK